MLPAAGRQPADTLVRPSEIADPPGRVLPTVLSDHQAIGSAADPAFVLCGSSLVRTEPDGLPLC